MNQSMRLVRIWSIILVILLLFLIFLGGFVTASGSGLGCGPDWPTCQGSLIPPDAFHSWVEWLHRLVAAVFSIMIVVLTVLLFRIRSADYRRRVAVLRTLGVANLVLLALQVILGAAIVKYNLLAWIVAVHMGTALILADLLVMITVLLNRAGTRPVSSSARPALWWAFGLSGAAAILGSYIAHSGAGDACPNLADCFTVAAWQHGSALLLLHIVSALALGVVAGGVFVRRNQLSLLPGTRFFLAFALILFGVQVVLGIFMLWTGRPTIMIAFHEPVGASIEVLLFAAAITENGLGEQRKILGNM